MRLAIILGTLSLALVTMPLPARAEPTPTFANIPWGSSDAVIKKTLEAKGFIFTKKDTDGDLDFKGRVNDKNVVIYELMTPSRQLVKAQVVFLTPDDEAISFYDEFKTTMVTKYGDPTHTFSFYSYPYTDSDPEAQHETAIAVGKGNFAAFWDFDNGGGIWITIGKKLTVEANYESSAWHAELARRKSSGNSVF